MHLCVVDRQVQIVIQPSLPQVTVNRRINLKGLAQSILLQIIFHLTDDRVSEGQLHLGSSRHVHVYESVSKVILRVLTLPRVGHHGSHRTLHQPGEFGQTNKMTHDFVMAELSSLSLAVFAPRWLPE